MRGTQYVQPATTVCQRNALKPKRLIRALGPRLLDSVRPMPYKGTRGRVRGSIWRVRRDREANISSTHLASFGYIRRTALYAGGDRRDVEYQPREGSPLVP